jgi:hypothetical protein
VRLIGAYSEEGALTSDISGIKFNRVRLNLYCREGLIALSIQNGKEYLLEALIAGEDQTDYVCELENQPEIAGEKIFC